MLLLEENLENCRLEIVDLKETVVNCRVLYVRTDVRIR